MLWFNRRRIKKKFNTYNRKWLGMEEFMIYLHF